MTAAKKVGADSSALEKQVDDKVYQLYNLTSDEIAAVEEAMK